MSRTSLSTRDTSALLVDTPVHRASHRNQGLPPKHGLLEFMAPPGARLEMQPATFYTLRHPRHPKPFNETQLEDVKDWLGQFEQVASFNQWDDAAKLRDVFFSLEDGDRTWFENRKDMLISLREFCRRIPDTFTSADR